MEDPLSILWGHKQHFDPSARNCNRCQECRCPEHFCATGHGIAGQGPKAAWQKMLDDVAAPTIDPDLKAAFNPAKPRVEFVRPGQQSGQERALEIMMDSMRAEIEDELLGAFALPEEQLSTSSGSANVPTVQHMADAFWLLARPRPLRVEVNEGVPSGMAYHVIGRPELLIFHSEEEAAIWRASE